MTLRETESVLALVAEIESLRQQLAAALAACKLKDEVLAAWGNLTTTEWMRVVAKVLAVQPDDSALKTWLGEPEWFYRKNDTGVNIFYEDIEERPAGCTPLYSPKRAQNK